MLACVLTERVDSAVGPMWLFFGCRQRALDLYKDEKAAMLKDGVLDQVFLALSREPTIPKVNNALVYCFSSYRSVE